MVIVPRFKEPCFDHHTCLHPDRIDFLSTSTPVRLLLSTFALSTSATGSPIKNTFPTPNTSKQGITLTVVCAVMVFDVGVSFLQIAEAEDFVDVGILLEGHEPCNIFRTDDNNKPTLTIIHQCVQ